MNTTSSQKSYLLLFRNTTWYRELSPEEIQNTMKAWGEWFNQLVADGRCLGGNPLGPEGRVVTGTGSSVTDGPFTESKEAVAGYFLLNVASEEEAVAIARQCPSVCWGTTVEVRPVLDSCLLQDSEVAEDALAYAVK